MKNIKERINELGNLKKQLAAVLTAGVMATTVGSVTASAEETKVTTQDIINAMITGNKITAEITEEEADKLIAQAEREIVAAGASILPIEFEAEYNKIQNLKGQEREKQLLDVAMLCDKLLFDGTANMMTYPESLQFENVCNKVCDELLKNGRVAIYSPSTTMFYNDGSDYWTDLSIIKQDAEQNRKIKKSSYVVALGADLGFYDHCYGLDENPNTGSKDYSTELMVGSASLAIAALAMPKKKKQYTKTK